METIIISAAMLFIIAFVVTSITIPLIIKLCRKKRLFAENGGRHIHVGKICAFGGVPIFLGIFGAQLYLLLDPPDLYVDYFPYYILGFSVALLFFVGFIDDLLDIKARDKFLIQLLLASLLVFRAGIYIESFHGLFGLYELPLWFAYPFSITTIIFLVNAFNLIDGVDSLSASIGILALSVFSYYFYHTGNYYDFLIAVSVLASLIGFWFFNKPPAKIFMGDTGTLSVGVLLAYFSIQMCNISTEGMSGMNPVFVMIVLSYPVIDTLRVFIKRISKGNSPFTPDRSHLHHRLIDLGYSHGKTTFIIIFVSLIFISLTYLLKEQKTLSFFVMLVLVGTSSQVPGIINWYRKKSI